jgi:hypothetical protein
VKLRTLALTAALLAIPLAAKAQPSDTERAAAEYDAGTRAFEGGDFAEAARAFERADAIAPHPRTRYNAALSWDRAGDAPRAADAYAAAVEGTGLDAERVAAARTRLRELATKIGALDVRRPVDGRVSVAHARDLPIPARIHVAPGVHRVELVSKDGSREEREVEVQAGERVVLEIAISKAPLAPPAAASSRPAPLARPEPEPEPDGSASTTWGWVALGGAAAFGAGAVWLGFETAGAIDEFDASGDRDAAARDRAVRYRALTWTAAGASLACATLGIVLLSTSDGEDVQVGISGSGVKARVRF